MFTKVILAVDMKEPLTDYMALARYVSSRVNIDEDIIMSKGPSDVLDHSSTKFAFGGKIGIDACKKPIANEPPAMVDRDAVLAKFPEIKSMNVSLLEAGISLVVMGVQKTRKHQMQELGKALLTEGLISGVKFLVFVDEAVDVNCLQDVAWLVLNNIDTQRDVKVMEHALVVDGTIKSLKLDNFERDWPNVIAMDDTIIKSVDEKWNRLGLGAFIDSPSLKYRKLMRGDGACIIEDQS